MLIGGQITIQIPTSRTPSTEIEAKLKAIVEDLRPKFHQVNGAGMVWWERSPRNNQLTVDYSMWEPQDVHRLMDVLRQYD